MIKRVLRNKKFEKNYKKRISGDLRVLYSEDGDSIILTDIGTHNQVY